MAVGSFFRSLRVMLSPRSPETAPADEPRSRETGQKLVAPLGSIEIETDSGTEAASGGDPAAGRPSFGSAYDETGPRELFAGIAAAYSQPVKDFIFELRRGTATKDWIDI